MNRLFTIKLFLFQINFLFSTLLFAQKTEKVYPFFSHGKLYQTKENLINVIQFKGDSSSFNKIQVKSSVRNPNLVVILDEWGTKLNQFLVHGALIGSMANLYTHPKTNDYFLEVRNSYNIYDKNNTKICDSSGVKSYRILKGNTQGNFSLFQDIRVDGTAKLAYSGNTNCLYVLFSNVKGFDTIIYGAESFRKDKSTLVKLKEDGTFDKSWLVDSIFNTIYMVKEKALLSTSPISKTNFTYSVDGTSYYRNNGTDKYLLDIPSVIYNLQTSKVESKNLIKSAGGNVFVENDKIFCNVGFADSLIINGYKLKYFGDFQNHLALINLKENFDTNWVKPIKSAISISDFSSPSNSLEFVLRTSNFLGNTWGGKPISGLSYLNRIILDENGNIARNYPIVLSNGAGTQVKLSNNSNRYFMNLIIADSITINGSKYFSRPGVGDYLFIAYNQDSISNGIYKLVYPAMEKIVIYPNPSNGNEVHLSNVISEGKLLVELINIHGQVIDQQELYRDHRNISINNIPSGIIFLRVFDLETNKCYSGKFIKK
jgi:hypothetical protein